MAPSLCGCQLVLGFEDFEHGEPDAGTRTGDDGDAATAPAGDAGGVDDDAGGGAARDSGAAAAGVDAGPGIDAATTGDAGASVGSDAAAQAPTDAGVDASIDAGPPDPLLEGCVLLLHMNESTWSGSEGEVVDGSGQGNDGQAVGTAAITALGRFGNSAQLDGDGWLTVPDAPSLRPSRAFTVSAWFYLDELPGIRYPGIITKRVAYQVDSAFALFIEPDNAIYVDVDGEESRFRSNVEVQAERWYHVALVFDGSQPSASRVRLYVDGVLDTTASEDSSSIPAYTPDVTIGNMINGSDTFLGRIDEVAIWTRALSTSEVERVASATGDLPDAP